MKETEWMRKIAATGKGRCSILGTVLNDFCIFFNEISFFNAIHVYSDEFFLMVLINWCK